MTQDLCKSIIKESDRIHSCAVCKRRICYSKTSEEQTQTDTFCYSTRMILYKMVISLILVLSLVTVSRGKSSFPYPKNGSCLCYAGKFDVEIRSTACDGEVTGLWNTSECYRYMGEDAFCDPHDGQRTFRIDWEGKEGWALGFHLTGESDSRCPTSADNPDVYTCEITDEGMRVHESSNTTIYDCLDSNCENTCKGGQSEAYVKCRCTKNGRYLPDFRDWSPGLKLTTADGKCNRNITENTAIATFDTEGRFTEHAAVFIKCQDDYTVQVYDQWCGRSVGYSTYHSSHSFFNSSSTIRSFYDGPNSISCRSETSGSTECAVCYKRCTDVTCPT